MADAVPENVAKRCDIDDVFAASSAISAIFLHLPEYRRIATNCVTENILRA